VVGAGDLDERQRLIGAYQGIALGMASRTAEALRRGRGPVPPVRHTVDRWCSRTLKDGYYLVVSLGPEALPPSPPVLPRRRCDRLDEEI